MQGARSCTECHSWLACISRDILIWRVSSVPSTPPPPLSFCLPTDYRRTWWHGLTIASIEHSFNDLDPLSRWRCWWKDRNKRFSWQVLIQLDIQHNFHLTWCFTLDIYFSVVIFFETQHVDTLDWALRSSKDFCDLEIKNNANWLHIFSSYLFMATRIQCQHQLLFLCAWLQKVPPLFTCS